MRINSFSFASPRPESRQLADGARPDHAPGGPASESGGSLDPSDGGGESDGAGGAPNAGGRDDMASLSGLSTDEEDEGDQDGGQGWFESLVEKEGLSLDQTPVPRVLWAVKAEKQEEEEEEEERSANSPESDEQEASSSSRYKAERREALLEMQRKAVTDAEYSDLKVAYERVLATRFGRDPAEAAQVAAKCVQAWQLAGVGLANLREVCTSVVQVPRCLEDFQDRFTSMLGSLFCFSDPEVDVRQVLKITLLFFGAGVSINRSIDLMKGRKPVRSFASIKNGAVSAAKEEAEADEEEATKKLGEVFDYVSDKLGELWSPARLGLVYGSFLNSVRGVTEREASAAFQCAALSRVGADPGKQREVLSTSVLKEVLSICRKLKLSDEARPEEEEEDIEDGEVLSGGESEDGGGAGGDVVVLCEDGDLRFRGNLTSTGDKAFHVNNFKIRTEAVQPPNPEDLPKHPDGDFQALFESFFLDTYRRGMSCQGKWKEVAAGVAEEFVGCWKVAGFDKFEDILSRVRRARQAAGKKSKATAAVFKYLVGCLQDRKGDLPPLVPLAFLARDTVVACQGIVAEEEERQRREEVQEVATVPPGGEPISDEEMETEEEVKALGGGAAEGEKAVSEEGEDLSLSLSEGEEGGEDAPRSNSNLDKMDEQDLQGKRAELLAQLEKEVKDGKGDREQEETEQDQGPSASFTSTKDERDDGLKAVRQDSKVAEDDETKPDRAREEELLADDEDLAEAAAEETADVAKVEETQDSHQEEEGGLEAAPPPAPPAEEVAAAEADIMAALAEEEAEEGEEEGRSEERSGGHQQEIQGGLASLFDFMKSSVGASSPSDADLSLESIISDKKSVSRLTGMADKRVEQALAEDEERREAYARRYASLEAMSHR